MTRHLRGIVCVAALATVLVASPALADAEDVQDGRIDPYFLTYTVQPDGTVDVVEGFTYDFGSTPNHGPERLIDTREAFDKDRYRSYRVEDVEASSSSGAPADVDVEGIDNQTRIRIGDPDETVSGPQKYRLSYTLVGALNAQPDGSGELFWDAAGPNWPVPLDNVAVTVKAPGGISKQRCLFGKPGSTDPCSSRIAGGDAVFAATTIEPGEVLTVVAAFSLADVNVPAPLLKDRNPFRDAFTPSPASVGGGVGAVALIGGVPLALAIRRRRDKKYVDQIPGLAPVPGQEAREEYVSLLEPDGTVVQFSPPKDVSPAEAGVLLDRKLSSTQTTATLLDLAVRGYLHIAETEVTPKRQQPKGWTLTATGEPDASLRPHEQGFLTTLFASMQSIALSKGGHLAAFTNAHRAVIKSLGKTVVDRNWFAARPAGALDAGSIIGLVFASIAILGGVIVGMVFLSMAGFGFLAAGILLALVVAAASLFVRRGRTASGEAIAQQVRGFRHYLEVAEAEKLRFEEGIDVFSRYLPWAVAFGIAEKWANVCHDLAKAGRIPASPSWYESTRPWSYRDYNTSLAGFSAAAVSNSSPPVTTSSGSSSSGGSGFSSSSSSGSGGGGGGGGSW
ncbi:DUF2207 domain-containing protein [Tenggerimyces flavus]|uniref:DUF2207 domain-containing protein n=1 Tax=Tenggerimyces flavus TaxID=1708749 RepID=A0ABV7YND2_9ACTN|nr:DUF2207 domain-containing protein [Tenggerimyces flavus]MBM7786271.1 putative membrane protein YgcG [Tenggerimyces flavus]